jgi:hypothetical protein
MSYSPINANQESCHDGRAQSEVKEDFRKHSR